MEKELKRRINKMMNELQAMKELIDSDALQEKQKEQEQPDNEDIDKVAQELYEHLYELKRRNNVPTNLYDKQEIIDLWKAGIVYGRSHPKQEQPGVDLENYISNKLRELGADLINHKPYSFNRGLNVGKTNAYKDILDRLNARREE